MSDITLGMEFKVEGKDAVGTIKVARSSLAEMRSEQAKATDEQKKATQVEEQLQRKTEEYVKTLVKKVATLGLTRTELLQYEAAQLRLTDAEQRAVVSMQTSVDAYEKKEAAMEKLIGTAGRLALGAAAAGVALAAMIKKEAITEAIEAAEAQVRLTSTLNATRYAAGITKAELDGMADGMAKATRFDDESIRNGIAALLKFKDVQGDTFREAIKVSADYAEHSGMDFKSAAEAVGRALQDPDHAMRLLIQTGGRFSESQRDQIKLMMETGHAADAQAMILDRLKESVGGTATAMNTGLMKAQADSKKSWNELLEAIGETNVVGGRFESTAQTLTQFFDILNGAIKGTDDTLVNLAEDLLKYNPLFSQIGQQMQAAREGKEVLQAQAASSGRYASGKITNAGVNANVQALQGMLDQAAASQQSRDDALDKELEKELLKEAEAYKKVKAAADEYLVTLQKEQDSIGATTEQKILLNAAIKAMTLSTMAERQEFLAKAVVIAHETQAREDNTAAIKKSADERKKLIEAQAKELDSIASQIEKQKEQNYELLNGKDSYDKLKIATLEAALVDAQFAGATDEDTAALRRKIVLLKELAGLKSTGEGIKDSQASEKAFYAQMQRDAEAFQTVLEDVISQALSDGGVKGADQLKQIFEKLVLRPTISGLSSGIGNLFSGANGASGAGGAGGSNLMSSFGQGFSLYNNTWGGGNGGMGPPTANGQMSMTYGNYASNAFAGAASGYAMGSSLNSAFGNQRNAKGMSVGGTIGGAIGSIWGPLGAMIGSAIGSALGSLVSSGGGKKQSGTSIYDVGPTGSVAAGQITDERRFYNTQQDGRTLDPIVDQVVKATAASYANFSRLFGFKSQLTFTQSTDTDPNGTADNRVATQAFLNGLKIFEQKNENLGRNPEAVGPELQLQAQRALLAAISKSDLPPYIAKLLDGVVAESQSKEEIDALLGRLADTKVAWDGLTTSMTAMNDMIALIGGDTMPTLKSQMKAFDDQVIAAQSAFDASMTGGDATEIFRDQQALQQAIVNRYQTERQWIEDIQNQVEQLKQASYQFAVSIAQKINSVGGSRDIGSLAAGRGSDIRDGLAGITDPAKRLAAIQQYIATVDTQLSSRRAALQSMAATQQAEADARAQSANAMQSAIHEARVSALQTELDLAKGWNSVLSQSRQLIDTLKYTAANPLSVQSRLAASTDDTGALFGQFQAASGQQKIDLASRLLPGLQTRLSLLQQSAQRPSQEYLDGYNDIIRQVSEVEAYAQSQDERAAALQAQMVGLQAEGNGLQQSTASSAIDITALLDELNAQALEQYQFAEAEGNAAYAQQQAQHAALLNTITGGMEVDLYLAKLQTDSRNGILAMVDLLREYLAGNAAGAGAGSGAGGGTGGGSIGSGSGGSGDSQADKTVNITLELDGRTLASVIAPMIDDRNAVTGTEQRRNTVFY